MRDLLGLDDVTVPDEPTPANESAADLPARPAARAAARPALERADAADDAELLAAVARVWRDVARDEEARFNGLNTRGLGVLTVSGLVVSIGALFAKDLLTERTLSEAGRWTTGLALGVALVVLFAAAVMVVLGVLRPRWVPVFGNNALVTNPDVVTSVRSVDSIVRTDYEASARGFQKVNHAKASWLVRSYLTVLVAVAAITVAGVASAVEGVVSPPG